MPEYYELSCFETDYSSFLKDRLLGGTKKYGSYIDPDCVKDVSKTDFYNDLADFLNGREKELEKELKNSYFFLPPAYAPQTPKWLQKHEDKKNSVDKKIITVEEKNDTGRLFFLKSDQFGFSAAETIYEKNKSDKHPLSRLLYQYKRQEKEEQDKIISRITEYIKNTRTIGGSFIWPVPLEGKRDFVYNKIRGVGSYLEDRVDLTLLEIKHVINGRNNNFEKCKSDIRLYGEYEKDGQGQKVNTHMKQWFDHFDSFQGYVEYFMLEPFCQKVMAKGSEKGYDYIPLNIIDGEPIDEKKIDDYREIYYKTKKKDRKGEVQTLNKEELINMLNRLEKMILERTENMESAIGSYRKEEKILHTKQ
jgi:hypothetical protein